MFQWNNFLYVEWKAIVGLQEIMFIFKSFENVRKKMTNEKHQWCNTSFKKTFHGGLNFFIQIYQHSMNDVQ
jgi:hypothetical protein